MSANANTHTHIYRERERAKARVRQTSKQADRQTDACSVKILFHDS